MSDKDKTTNVPECSCTGGHKPILFNGEMVTFLSPSCQIHQTTFTSINKPQSAETIVGNWKDKGE